MKTSTISEVSSAKLTRQKSSFYAYAFPVQTIQECKEYIAEVKAKHKANHFPFAYRITIVNQVRETTILQRQNDDGEPSHSAGSPLLSLIKEKQLTNILIVVARVFGGIYLGPSGLAKAFRDAGNLSIKNLKTTIFEPIIHYTTTVSPKQANLLKIWCKQNKLSNTMERIEKEEILCIIDIPLEKKSLISDAQRLK